MAVKTVNLNGKSVVVGPSWNPDLPSIYQIEAFNRCNLRCPFCLTGIEDNPFGYDESAISWELFTTIVNRDLGGSRFIELQMRGEPTLHKRLAQMVYLLRDKVFVGFSTHGGTLHLPRNMDAALASHYLTISIDAGTKEGYDQKRVGGRWEVLLKNIDDLLKLRCDNEFPIIDLQLIEEDNSFQPWQQELEALHQLADDRGWERVNIRSIHNTSLAWKDKDLTVINYDLCLNPWLSVSIKCNGDVVPCCMAFEDEKEMTYGNLNEASLEEIWNNDKVKAFRKRHLVSAAGCHGFSPPLPDTCRMCYSRSPALLHDKLLYDAIKSVGMP